MIGPWLTSGLKLFPLIRLYQLSGYDAAYLALAVRLKVPLATLDEKLRTAATLEHVPLAI